MEAWCDIKFGQRKKMENKEKEDKRVKISYIDENRYVRDGGIFPDDKAAKKRVQDLIAEGIKYGHIIWTTTKGHWWVVWDEKNVISYQPLVF